MLLSILMCETFEISIQDNPRCFTFASLCCIEIFWKWSEVHVYPSEVILSNEKSLVTGSHLAEIILLTSSGISPSGNPCCFLGDGTRFHELSWCN